MVKALKHQPLLVIDGHRAMCDQVQTGDAHRGIKEAFASGLLRFAQIEAGDHAGPFAERGCGRGTRCRGIDGDRTTSQHGEAATASGEVVDDDVAGLGDDGHVATGDRQGIDDNIPGLGHGKVTVTGHDDIQRVHAGGDRQLSPGAQVKFAGGNQATDGSAALRRFYGHDAAAAAAADIHVGHHHHIASHAAQRDLVSGINRQGHHGEIPGGTDCIIAAGTLRDDDHEIANRRQLCNRCPHKHIGRERQVNRLGCQGQRGTACHCGDWCQRSSIDLISQRLQYSGETAALGTVAGPVDHHLVAGIGVEGAADSQRGHLRLIRASRLDRGGWGGSKCKARIKVNFGSTRHLRAEYCEGRVDLTLEPQLVRTVYRYRDWHSSGHECSIERTSQRSEIISDEVDSDRLIAAAIHIDLDREAVTRQLLGA